MSRVLIIEAFQTYRRELTRANRDQDRARILRAYTRQLVNVIFSIILCSYFHLKIGFLRGERTYRNWHHIHQGTTRHTFPAMSYKP